MTTKFVNILDTFDNPYPNNDYVIKINSPEFTCLCPKTGQPDFATIYLKYIANKQCVELKSYKEYLRAYRDIGAFHEKVTNDILADLVAVLSPKMMKVKAVFNVRGGIYTTIKAIYKEQ